MFNRKKTKVEIVAAKMYKATDGSLHQTEDEAFRRSVFYMFKKYKDSDGDISYWKIADDWDSFVKKVNGLNAD